MICPICRETEIGFQTGPTVCTACKAGFEIDDRGECIFADAERLRIPVDGLLCMACGLVQEGKWEYCVYCRTILSKMVH